jgi:hypothetical protein
LERGHLLLGLVVCVIVWSCEDERDRLGAEVAAPDEPLVSLKGGGVSRALVAGPVLLSGLLFGFGVTSGLGERLRPAAS